MVEQIPVTPELLTWARERAGFSLEEAKKRFKNFDQWENGSTGPTYSQLESLSDLFKVPVAVFFFPKPPELPKISETFRTLPQSEVERLPRQIRLHLRKAKALQLNLAELTGGINPALKLITRDLRLSANLDLQESVEMVRQFIGVSVIDQKSWSDSESALKGWRSRFKEVGVFVFKEAFRADGFSGFCLFDDVFPIIYVNNSSSVNRQIFTLFHELAHLLFHTSGIDTIDDDYFSDLDAQSKKIEVVCNQFASEFLLPDRDFLETISNLHPSEETAEFIANQYHVSREVVYRRFLDKGLIDQSEYNAKVSKWNSSSPKNEGSGGNYYWTKLMYLGRDYVSLALSQFHQDKIDETRLAEFLDVKPKSLSTLENYFERGEI